MRRPAVLLALALLSSPAPAVAQLAVPRVGIFMINGQIWNYAPNHTLTVWQDGGPGIGWQVLYTSSW